MTPLLTARRDAVLVLTLNRPERRNALDAALRAAIVEALAAAVSDDGVGAVVLSGAGEDFCAGFDLQELASGDAAAIFRDADGYHRGLHTFAKPLVAAIMGRALAGGLDLALLCDLRVAGPTARFGQPQVRRGIPAAFELVRSVVGDAVARDLCLTGRQVEAAEALQLGIVHRLADDPLAAALELAQELASSAGARAVKRAIVAGNPDLFGSA
jgi:enoyl-CoA hydratase